MPSQFENDCQLFALKGGILNLKHTKSDKGNERYYVNTQRVSYACYTYFDRLCKKQSSFSTFIAKNGTVYNCKLVSVR